MLRGVIMYICEKCGKEHDGSFGSGRFCCRSCSNSRNHTQETKDKIKDSINKYLADNFSNTENGEFINSKESKRRKKYENANAIKEFVDKSNDVKFLTHPEIDFGVNYIISKCGKVISSKTLKCLSPAFKNWNDPYVRYVLTDVSGIQHIVTAHRLVAYNFLPNEDDLPLVNHKDCDPSNNNVENLEWCTHRYNSIYMDAHIKRGKIISQTIKDKGGQWNKGKKLKKD